MNGNRYCFFSNFFRFLLYGKFMENLKNSMEILWTCMDMHGNVWKNRNLLKSMENVWNRIENLWKSNENLWKCMDTYGNVSKIYRNAYQK